MTTTTAPKLGCRQRAVLTALVARQSWHADIGWGVERGGAVDPYATSRVLDRLVEMGYARHSNGAARHGRYGVYGATPAGAALVRAAT